MAAQCQTPPRLSLLTPQGLAGQWRLYQLSTSVTSRYSFYFSSTAAQPSLHTIITSQACVLCFYVFVICCICVFFKRISQSAVRSPQRSILQFSNYFFKVSSTLNPCHIPGRSHREGKKIHLLSAFEPASQEHPGIKVWEKISAKGEIILSYYID